MPLYLDDFINILAEICEEKNLRVAVSECVKGGLATGLAAIIGGLLMGPVGLAIGGALGGGASAISARGKFEPVAAVLIKMTPRQKKRLYERVRYAFRDLQPHDALALSTLLVSQFAFKELAIGVVKDYLSNELSLRIME